MDINEALERWENSGGLACSDPYDDGTIEVLFTLAQAYVSEQSANDQLAAACRAALEALTSNSTYHHREAIEKLRAAIGGAE